MSLIMKSVLITAGLGLLFVIVEWNMMRKKKEGVDWKAVRLSAWRRPIPMPSTRQKKAVSDTQLANTTADW